MEFSISVREVEAVLRCDKFRNRVHAFDIHPSPDREHVASCPLTSRSMLMLIGLPFRRIIGRGQNATYVCKTNAIRKR
ncbi:hypothetical protein BDD14_5286 [Edaphobacter modestus]|uniref:Uncharacterized protein n=1 Tax=Edaphobacter modestus TaxID=388466 RepID=A0A4Q7Z0H5_9BACT|nr:hypothetical protein BDD14_5286 [Edaphobacter modestus]